MPAVISLIVILISTALFAGSGADVSVKAAHNTTVEFKCTASEDDSFPPAWVINGSAVISRNGYRSSIDENTGKLIGTLTINGNQTCGTFRIHCILLPSGQIMHSTMLTVEGPLPPPEGIHVSESNNSLVIEWNPPYSVINTNSSVMHIDPHIIQYTVYIVDNYTNYVEKVNVAETSFRRNIPNDNSCPMYRVTAWNSGGEGNMSVPLPGARAPNSIAAEDIDIHSEPRALEIHLRVTDLCTVRMPNYFLVTVTSTDGVIITTVQHPVATVRITTIHVTLPQNVDECNLIVRISAGSSAGMSSPTETTIGCQTAGPSTDPTTTTTTSTGSDTTSTDLVDQTPQGDNNIMYIATAVGAVVVVTAVALLLIILWKCKRPSKVEKDEVVMHHNQAYETVTRMNHSRPVTEVPTEPCPAYGVVGSYHE